MTGRALAGGRRWLGTVTNIAESRALSLGRGLVLACGLGGSLGLTISARATGGTLGRAGGNHRLEASPHGEQRGEGRRGGGGGNASAGLGANSGKAGANV